jgi:hypothetical protein
VEILVTPRNGINVYGRISHTHGPSAARAPRRLREPAACDFFQMTLIAEGALKRPGRGVDASARADSTARAQARATLALASAIAQLTRPTETDVN